VRADGLPEGGLLQVQLGGEHARGGAAQHRLRGRHRPLPGRELRHHCRHQRQESLHLGINIPRRIRRGGQGAKKRKTVVLELREVSAPRDAVARTQI